MISYMNTTVHIIEQLKLSLLMQNQVYINFNKENNKEDPKFKIGNHVGISKYKNIFAKDFTPNFSEDVFVIKKVKNIVQWTYVINDLNSEEIVRTFFEKGLQKQIKKSF